MPTKAELEHAIVLLEAYIDLCKTEITRLGGTIPNQDEPPVDPPVDPPPVPSRKLKIPTVGAYLGATVNPKPGESRAQCIARLDTESGRKLALTHYFLTGTAWPAADIQADVTAGRVPHLSWKPGAWADVAAGKLDTPITAFATKVKALNGPTLVTFHHEPTNDTGDPATYVAAWKRFRQVMDRAGVDNASYIWVMIAYDLRPTFNADAWFPGKATVDFIGIDPYNWAPVRPNSTWTEFAKVIEHSLTYAAKQDMDVFVCETGTNEDPAVPGRKAKWIDGLLATFIANPRLKGLEYFNKTHTNSSGSTSFTNRWSWDTSPTSLAAWKRLGTHTHFDAKV